MDLIDLAILEKLKNKIESLNKYHQLEILKILSRSLCKINENKSGVYVNLSFLEKPVIDDMFKYLEYIKEQEESLNTMEYQKEEFKNSYFCEKEDKDNKRVLYSSISNVVLC